MRNVHVTILEKIGSMTALNFDIRRLKKRGIVEVAWLTQLHGKVHQARNSLKSFFLPALALGIGVNRITLKHFGPGVM